MGKSLPKDNLKENLFSDLDAPFETVDAVTTAVTASVTRKSGNICQLEHLSNGSAVLTREHNPTSSNRKMTSPRSGALVKRPKIVSGELVETGERKGTEREGRSEYEFDTGEQDDVFEPHDPKKDSNIFVYSASNEPVKRKARKNLLTFKSPPPPDVLDASTLTIENEKKSKRLKGFHRQKMINNTGILQMISFQVSCEVTKLIIQPAALN